ncbi:MAG: CPBP family intramembrane metalloprotease [Bacteroidaceae bacterium]|nr:CPBP family intramembrane metalloprotease [Bacteroidaceae bacterium]
MIWHKYSPAILTVLVFLLVQGIGSVLLFAVGVIVSPEFGEAVRAFVSGKAQGLPFLELIPVSAFSIVTAVTDILAVLICYFLLHYIRFSTAFNTSSIKLRPSLLAISGSILGALSVSILTESVELSDEMMQISVAMSHNFWGLLTVVFVGPIVEELLFREAIEGEMLRRNVKPWIAILVSAIAFSVSHLNLAQGLYAFSLAILFGIIYYKTGNIILTSLLHILNNGFSAVQLYLYDEGIEDVSYADLFGGTLQSYTFMLLSGVISVALITTFCKDNPSYDEFASENNNI